MNRPNGDERTDGESVYRPSVLRVLRKSGADAWVYLALFVGVNVVWVVLLGLPLGVAGRLALNPRVAGLALVATIMSAAAGNAVLFHVTNRIAHGDACAADLWAGLRQHLAPSLMLLVLIGAFLAAGAFNFYFYSTLDPPRPWWRVIGIIWAYVTVMFAAAMFYSYPLLVEQRRGPWSAIKRSALLAVDNPGFTLGALGALAAWTLFAALPLLIGASVLVGLSALAFCFVEAGAVALVANNALLELLRKYEALESKRDARGGMSGDTGG